MANGPYPPQAGPSMGRGQMPPRMQAIQNARKKKRKKGMQPGPDPRLAAQQPPNAADRPGRPL